MSYRVLFLCTGNSARSILAEAYLNFVGAGRFRAESAGSQPKGVVHPMALSTLERHGISTLGLRSKSWDEFEGESAIHLDLVITVCDNAGKEACPVWRGTPARVSWSFEDPAAFAGDPDAQVEKFEEIFTRIRICIDYLAKLPLESMDRSETHHQLMSLQERV